MNFVVKNLGWILLLIFFVFMLFIISSNNKTSQDVLTGSISTETGSGAKEDLDNLVEMIDDTEDEEVSDAEMNDADEPEASEDEEDSENEDTNEEKGGFFSKMFGGNSQEENTEDVKEAVLDSELQTENENLVKNTENGETSLATVTAVQKYAPEILSQPVMNYPGINLESEVGKQFEIGVYSLKLNNKYFTETLAYMMKGDRVEQLGEENIHGCFEVEVISAQNEVNIGKVGYVCKKYLTDSTENAEENTKNPAVSLTKVGDVITVEKEVTLENGIMLSVGDTIDQMSPASEEGCFIAHILKTQISPEVVPVANICLSNIK